MEEKNLQQQATLEKISLPPHVSHWIVRSYLLHYGYQDTLNSYDITTESMYPLIPKVQGNGFSEQTNVYALNHRKILRQLIKNGDIGSAFQKLQEWYPQVVQDDASVVCFLLHSQRFIECIRVGNLEDAITYAQAQLAKYFNVRPFSELLGREFVADAVNAVILSTNPDLEDAENCMQTCLEKLLRQFDSLQLGVQGIDWSPRRVIPSSQRTSDQRKGQEELTALIISASDRIPGGTNLG